MCLLEGLTWEDLEVEYRGFSANDFLSVGDFPSYFASRMQARLPENLEHTQVPAQRYQEICQRFGFARSYIGRLYSNVHERDLEIDRLRRHQSHQSSVVRRLQAEVERLRTRLEVEGIPFDSSEEVALLLMMHHCLHPLRLLLVRAVGRVLTTPSSPYMNVFQLPLTVDIMSDNDDASLIGPFTLL
ncbi:hypothetical protein JCGZ_26582 [Jatropha curcas]|uniref:Aminotransferase-like plant mobile domain-containing protein n=1 Tax=Jatropha curcas TaxID=180498 RepID=A0A067JKK7_JATCU|nr:hypothetical protein JCGZ_26582 [Jatropha curcas]